MVEYSTIGMWICGLCRVYVGAVTGGVFTEWVPRLEATVYVLMEIVCLIHEGLCGYLYVNMWAWSCSCWHRSWGCVAFCVSWFRGGGDVML